MSFTRVATKYNPWGLFQMDDSSPLQDYSPFNRNAVVSGGTPARHPSLIKGATYAPVFTTTITAAFDCPGVFVQGKESDSFAIGATVAGISGVAPQQILSHSGQFDGLSINGNVISFSTQYLTTGSATVTYDLQVARAVQAIGVHNSKKNSLYIDGVLVGEVEITPAQQADQYVATDGKLYMGATTGASKIAVSGAIMFAGAPTQEAILDMFQASRAVPSADAIVQQNAGIRLDMSRNISSVFVDQWWTTEQDWKSATLNNVVVVNDRLQPVFAGNVSQAGYWIDSFSLNSAGVTSIYGVNFDWDGNGAVVEASLDGTAWTAVTRGVNTSVIPAGFNPTGKQLLVRVSFPGGITNDTSYIDSLNATGFKTAASTAQYGRTITLTNAYEQRAFNPIEMNDRWGTEIGTGGTLAIGADTSDQPTSYRTLGIWIKPLSATNPTISVTGTYYQNGVAATATLPTGQWTLMHIVSATDITSFTITGNAQVGQIALFPTLTAQNVSDLYNSYFGANVLTVGDNSVITLTQSTDAASIYAFNWSILASG